MKPEIVQNANANAIFVAFIPYIETKIEIAFVLLIHIFHFSFVYLPGELIAHHGTTKRHWIDTMEAPQ